MFAVMWLIIFLSGNSYASYGNPKAPQKGTFQLNLGKVPPTLNPITSTDGYARNVQNYVMESLLGIDPDTYEWIPGLAKEWKISDNGLEYEFTLREGVKWHDGKPLTVEDVKFSFDLIRNNEWDNAHARSYFESLTSCKIIGKNKVKFIANKKYFRNFSTVASLLDIVPKHVYTLDKKNKKKTTYIPPKKIAKIYKLKKGRKVSKKKLNKVLIGSGPYFLKKYDRKKFIVLKRNPNWWGNKVKQYKGEYNFDKIVMRFVDDKSIAFESFKKRKIDFLGVDPEDFFKKAKGKGWDKNKKGKGKIKWLKKQVKNSSVKGYGFVAWNLKSPLFNDVKVRKALYHLMDRRKMIKKFDYDMNIPATGPLYQQSPYADPSLKPIEYNPAEALKLLNQAGWKDTDGDRILDKVIKGKKYKMEFTILEPSKDLKKYLEIYQQDAKRAGVNIKIKIIEWNAFIKKMDERKFQAVRLAWGGGGIHWDPKQIWHSKSIKNKGSNFISYHNEKVDKLIDQAREIIDDEKRRPILKKVYRAIANDYPYAFMFNRKYSLYLHQKYTKMPKDTYKFSIGTSYWWYSK